MLCCARWCARGPRLHLLVLRSVGCCGLVGCLAQPQSSANCPECWAIALRGQSNIGRPMPISLGAPHVWDVRRHSRIACPVSATIKSQARAFCSHRVALWFASGSIALVVCGRRGCWAQAHVRHARRMCHLACNLVFEAAVSTGRRHGPNSGTNMHDTSW